MSDKGDKGSLGDRIARLSPEKRAKLEEMLLARRGAVEERGVRRGKGAGPWPASYTQRRLWFLWKLEPESTAYNEATAYRLKGEVDAAALERALGEVVRRHEALRTTFAEVDGEPVQVVGEWAPFVLRADDVRGVDEGEREAEAARLVEEEVEANIDLSKGPLFRARLVRLGEREHIFVFVMHHIVSDGWSMRVFSRELSELYSAYREGREAELAELPVQYADFAVWQRAQLDGETTEKLLSYWEERLSGAPVLELPTDRARGAVGRHRGGRYRFVIGRELAGRLEEVARGERVTLFIAMMAAYKVLLHRYSGQEDIVVGSPIANRNRVELEGLIGFFANTLALRSDLSGNPTFRELLARERESALGAYGHQDMPFEKLVGRLQPERDLSWTPVCQVMFALQNTPTGGMKLAGLEAERFETEKHTAKFDLILFANQGEGGIECNFEYNADLFDAGRVERMAGHFVKVLEAVTKDAERRIEEIELLGEEEREQIVGGWNETGSDYPREATVHGLFEEVARERPEASAVSYGGETLTYGELEERSNRLAAYLRRAGVEAGDRVGLSVARSVRMVEGMLGILKCGAAYVPLDPSYPQERLAFLAQDAGLEVVVTEEAQAETVGGLGAKGIVLEREAGEIAKEDCETIGAKVTAESAAYVIYTSGSTGTPKGAVIPHRAIVRLVRNTNYIELGEGDRVGQASNASFDAATFEIWGALLTGAQLVGIEKEVALSPGDFAEELKERRVTVLFLTTALFNYLAREAPGTFSGLKSLMFGGEACDVACVRRALAEGGQERLLHVYGPTESTTFATWYEVKEVAEGVSTVPIGRPIANTSVYILDKRMQPAPVGVPGEIYIGGDGLALGYLGREELTAEAFVGSPFEEGERLYRTGDMGIFLPDGNVEFVGRADFQVKIRGFRVELGEIEAVLGEHEGVKEAAVLCREDEAGEKRIVAYVAVGEGGKVEAGGLRAYLSERLPEYMLPGGFAVMEKLPLTPNGKVDRKALAGMEETGARGERDYLAPRTPAEEALEHIWKDALGLERVGVRDNFFELGGHSLLAVKVFSQIEKIFGRKLPLATLFQAPTIERLAEAMGARDGGEMLPTVVTIEKGDGGPAFFGIATADAFIYAELSKALGKGQAFYGLHPQGIVDVKKPEVDVRALAARYVEEMKRIQPEGPYHMGGMCAGGFVAYEAGKLLMEEGREVGVVALFDAPGPVWMWYRFFLLRRWMGRSVEHMYQHMRILWGLGWREKWDYAKMRAGRLKRKLKGERVGPTKKRKDVPVDRAYWMVFNGAYMYAAANYRPEKFPGKLVLFHAENAGAWRYSGSRAKWGKLAAGGVEIETVPGAHSEILHAPNVAVMAEKLARHMRGGDGG